MLKKGFKIHIVILIIIITSVISAVTTGVIINFNYKAITGMSYAEIITDESLNEFVSIYSQIKEKFYGEYDEEEMLAAATEAMVSYEGSSSSEALEYGLDAMLEYLGDEYTVFLDSEEYSYLSDELSGTYRGIGITISSNQIISITADSPAEDADLAVGDYIIGVNGQEVTSDNASIISIAIAYSTVDYVDLTILRADETVEITVQITTLDSSTNYFYDEDTKIGYINLTVFSENCYESFNSALAYLENLGMESLIIDLRYNGGGYLEQAIAIAELFLDDGDIINSIVSNDGTTINYDETEESRDYEIVVLLNEESASASEVLAAALIDNDKAITIGVTSYGKGTVQEIVSFSNGSSAKYTTAYWYTPDNININETGIEPDYYIELEYVYDENEELIGILDTQYLKAIEILTGA